MKHTMHTLGPWRYDNGDVRDLKGRRIAENVDGGGHPFVRDEEKNEANGRLMAAAPEMLAVLDSLSWVKPGYPLSASDLASIRCAIASATGQEVRHAA